MMRRTYETTIEDVGRGHAVDVEIEFDAMPGEPMVRYYPDGSGYPGSPPEADVVSVRVQAWHIDGERRDRDSSSVWKCLDRLASRVIARDLDRYEGECLESVDEE